MRFYCTKHNVRLENVGNGRFLYPTSSDEPAVDEDGYWELDLSEFSCPQWTEEDDCSDNWDIQFKAEQLKGEDTMPTNVSVYPVTAAFEAEMAPQVEGVKWYKTPSGLFSPASTYKVFKEVIGEYEHGTADVDVFFERLLQLRAVVQQDSDDDREVQREMMQVYADIAKDLLLSLINQAEPESARK